MDEACETKLLYLGDYLFGELHRKNIISLPPPIFLEDIREACLLHCYHNIPELYLEHVRQTTFNSSNVNIVENLETFVSPTDTTVILGTTTLLDADFVPKEKIKPDPNMVETNQEKTMPEAITWEHPIKKEPAESYSKILTSHSPNCELWMQITNIISLRGEESPTDTAEYSTDSTILGGNLTLQAHLLNSSSQTNDDQHPILEDSASQDITPPSVGTLQDVTNSVATYQNTAEQSSSYNEPVDKTTVAIHLHSSPTDTRNPDSTKDDKPNTNQTLDPVINITPEYDNSQDVMPATNHDTYRQDVTFDTVGLATTQGTRSDVMLPLSINMSMLQASLSTHQTGLQMDTSDPTFNGNIQLTCQDITNTSSVTMLQDVTADVSNQTYSNNEMHPNTSVTTCKQDKNITLQEVTTCSSSTIMSQDVTVNTDSSRTHETTGIGKTDPLDLEGQLDITQGTGVPTWANIVHIPSPGDASSDDTIDDSANLNSTNNTVEALQEATASVNQQLSLSKLEAPQNESHRIRELCKSLSLMESVYSSNSDTYYPILTPDESDVDYINFKDIINKSWSVSLDNLSVKDIELELFYLKQHKTSSPKTQENISSARQTSTSLSSQKDDSATENDNEKTDPTYGIPTKKKASKHPRRHPSAARIAVQKIILKTKGPKIDPDPSRPTPNQTRLRKRKLELDDLPATPDIPGPKKAASSGTQLTTSSDTADPATPKIEYRLKITHHGIS